MGDFFGTTGKRIKVLRDDLGLTQGEITRQLLEHGITINPSYVSVLERSQQIPSGKVLVALAKVLRTTTDYLLMQTDDPMIPSELDEEQREVSNEEWALVQDIRRIVPEDRQLLIETARSMAELTWRAQERGGRGAETPSAPAEGRRAAPRGQSREELVTLLSMVPDVLLEELARVATEMARKSDRRA